MKKVPEMFLKNGLSPYDGKGYMYVSYMDPETNTYYDIVDAYALTSLISIPQNGNTTLRFMLNGKNYTGQTLEILTGESDDPAKFDKVGMITLDSSANGWKQYTFDLTEWAGKNPSGIPCRTRGRHVFRNRRYSCCFHRRSLCQYGRSR